MSLRKIFLQVQFFACSKKSKLPLSASACVDTWYTKTSVYVTAKQKKQHDAINGVLRHNIEAVEHS